jgi:hypothetical protein
MAGEPAFGGAVGDQGKRRKWLPQARRSRALIERNEVEFSSSEAIPIWPCMAIPGNPSARLTPDLKLIIRQPALEISADSGILRSGEHIQNSMTADQRAEGYSLCVLLCYSSDDFCIFA